MKLIFYYFLLGISKKSLQKENKNNEKIGGLENKNKK